MFEQGETVRLNLDDSGENWVPAVVNERTSGGEYWVTAFPGRKKDTDSLQADVSVVGPIGEGVVRYGISGL